MTMHQRWTLHVEHFARFEQADFDLRPLTLFVGENNSGKSYVDQELIAPDKVAAFQFRRERQITQVARFEQSEGDIAVPTFNEPLESLLEEVLTLQDNTVSATQVQ
ncbi:hypothetical protein [Halomonas sp. LBP4]|uniref:hypothetical protein n=1 Tax=Halomonas sp. LBP4 TaxID=2044917 RepID=UPI000D75579D|nr:hypothetical protein [Halomonas sp. LBP4]PXX97653.1 hypothetical protein CR157_13225 [Halomonas sp. LBP4]